MTAIRSHPCDQYHDITNIAGNNHVSSAPDPEENRYESIASLPDAITNTPVLMMSAARRNTLRRTRSEDRANMVKWSGSDHQ